MRKVTRSMQEVEITTILCDLCGSDKNVPRYSENRTCERCQREVCGECQGPYPEEEISDETICKHCKVLEAKFQPLLNEAYREYGKIKAQWKAESLAMSLIPGPSGEQVG